MGSALAGCEQAGRGDRPTSPRASIQGQAGSDQFAARSSQCQYDAIAVVGAADREQPIDCNDCDSDPTSQLP